MNDVIAKAIEASRERENILHPGYVNGALRYEPRFREALAVAVEYFAPNLSARCTAELKEQCACDACLKEEALTRIAAILAGEES